MQIALESIRKEGYDVRPQLPRVSSEFDMPFPNMAVVAGSPRDHLHQHPTDTLLIAEGSDTFLKTDREVKGRLYASAGIPEYWIVNLRERELEVYREPAAETRAMYGAPYRQRLILQVDEQISPLFAPEATLQAAQLLP